MSLFMCLYDCSYDEGAEVRPRLPTLQQQTLDKGGAQRERGRVDRVLPLRDEKASRKLSSGGGTDP